MKITKIAIVFFVASILFGCKKESAPTLTGRATFWYDAALTEATVNIGINTRYITKYYPSSAPDCGSDGCANFLLPVGVYDYEAHNSLYTWHGTVIVAADGCAKIRLYY